MFGNQTGRFQTSSVYVPVSSAARSELRKVEVRAFIPDRLPPAPARSALIEPVLDRLLTATSLLGRLAGRAMELPNPSLLTQPLMMREAGLSSRIENTIASAEEMALFQIGAPPDNQDVLEVVNYLNALQHGLSSPTSLTVSGIRELHSILLQNVRGDDKRPGEFRSVQVYIGIPGQPEKARYVPPPPDCVADLMADLERFINPPHAWEQPRDRLPELIEAAVAHYQFEAIHPFMDGNGRVGRLIIALMLCRSGLIDRPLVYLSAYFEQHRQRYYDLMLRISHEGDWNSWISFFLEAVITQSDDAIRRANSLRALHKWFLKRIAEVRSPSIHRIIDQLFVTPAFTANSMALALGIPVQTVQRNTDKLVERGVVNEVTGGTYGRIYLARLITEIADADTPEIERFITDYDPS